MLTTHTWWADAACTEHGDEVQGVISSPLTISGMVFQGEIEQQLGTWAMTDTAATRTWKPSTDAPALAAVTRARVHGGCASCVWTILTRRVARSFHYVFRDEAASEEVTATPLSQLSRAILVGLQKQLEGMAVALPTA